MTCVIETDAHFIVEFHKLIVENRLYELQGFLRVLFGVQRLHERSAGSGVLSVLPFSFLFVDVSAVQQHDPQQVRSRIRAVDLPFEPSLHKKRDPAAVIDMRMTQDHALDLCRIKGEQLR